MVDIHYMQMIKLKPATAKTCSLRFLLNYITQHIRCLAVLKQNVEQDVFVAMIRAKLPEEVLTQLEMLNGAKTHGQCRNYVKDLMTI